MKRVNLISISSISNIPVIRFIVQHFVYEKKSSILFVESRIKGANSYYEKIPNVKEKNLMVYDSELGFKSASSYDGLIKYIKLLKRLIFILISNNREIIYTNNHQVLFFAFILIRIVGNKNTKIIYHQFEIVEPQFLGKISRLFYQYVLNHIDLLDLAIFPEINRLEYFKNVSLIKKERTLLFPNSCVVQENEKNNNFNKYLKIPESHYVVLHVGAVGGLNHYISEYLIAIEKLSTIDKLSFVFVGRLVPEVINLINKSKNSQLYHLPSVPHEDLSHFYSRANLGVILYKDQSLNYKFCAPNKLYEYWSFGVQVIGHKLDGLKQVFSDQLLGVLIDFSNPIEIEENIVNLLKEEKRKKESIQSLFKKSLDVRNNLNELDKKLEGII